MNPTIHARTDVLGKPTAFHVTLDQASNLKGTDGHLNDLDAEMLLDDKAYDADEQVIERLQQTSTTPVIPLKYNRQQPREYE